MRSMSSPIRWMRARSAPKILMPTGVLMPVSSMSRRFWIGWVQTLGNPGNWSAASISPWSASVVSPGRHSSFGFSVIVVLTIPIGELSVEVVARPTVPKTRSTSGNCRSNLSCTWSRPSRLPHRQARRCGRHVEHRAFIERRHELAADREQERQGQRHDREVDDQRRPPPAERQSQDPERRPRHRTGRADSPTLV